MFTLLVVEDHDGNRKLFRKLLQMSFHVVEARSAEEALEHLSTMTPDLILLDYHLPGMDGLAFARKLKARAATAWIPVVVISAGALARDQECVRALGCVDFITKPISDTPVAFIDRLTRHVHPPSEDEVPGSHTQAEVTTCNAGRPPPLPDQSGRRT